MSVGSSIGCAPVAGKIHPRRRYENKQDGARLIKRVNEVRWDRKEKWARFLPEQSDNV